MPGFEERIYELGVEALAEQERQVSEVRSRATALLAAGAVVVSLLAKPVFMRATHRGSLKLPSEDVVEQPGVDLVLADAFEDRRNANQGVVDRLTRLLRWALLAIVVETVGLATAAVLAS
jgi:hypothetical protein